MKALQLAAFGQPTTAPELVETDPVSPKAGQVLVALEAAPINPSDLLLITGRYGVRPPLPAPLGAEGVGRIIEVGPDVDRSRVGERVVLVPRYHHGTWRDQTVAAERDVVSVDPNADLLQLSMLGINPITADLVLRSFVDLSPGAWVGQTGANSAVGRHVISLAKNAGLRTLNVVRRPEAASGLREAGADAVVVAGPDLAEQVGAALGDERPSLLLDIIGGNVVTEMAHWVAPGGTVVSYGGMSGEPAVIFAADLIFRNVSLRGFWLVHWLEATSAGEIAAAYERLATLVAKGVLSAPVDASYPLESYRDALAHAAKSGRDGKVVFTW
jgi:NADPH:quinone reductase-like Zn-dependent oxidoreductase